MRDQLQLHGWLGLLACVLLSPFSWRMVSGEEALPVPVEPKHPKEASVAQPKQMPKHTNRLAKETSPYLLQHQHNPVDWHAWGTTAFEKALKENKPVFLSVGYSACHWCHVMERESFEDEEVAQLLNAHFICVKVDREERPDVDDIYMRYVHLTQQRGGWPMSIVMTPEGLPFFGGTYYPKPVFMRLLTNLHTLWNEQRDKITQHTGQAVAQLREEADARYRPPQRPLTQDTPVGVLGLLERHFDLHTGGMQGRMKFPPHQTLEMLVELAAKNPQDERARKLLTLTLDHMQLGGIHDHLAGGFHRYATDPEWLLPHFEKMLYDNAQAGRYFSRAAVVLKDESYSRTARSLFEWVLRDLRSPEGVFYSAYDADSEGEEGKFYVWDKKEVEQLLGEDAKLWSEVYNLRAVGNYNEEATGHPTGLNIPHLSEPLAVHAQRLKIPETELHAKCAELKAKLLEVRRQRVWPQLDDKVLTSWNALMLGSLAKGSQYLNEPRYRVAAVQAAEWLLKHHRTPDGRWLATSRKGDARLVAYLDDHAYLACAFLDLHDATGDKRWVNEAQAVVTLLDKHFWDAKNGGYFFVSDDHEKLLLRVKNPNDNATPSGNGMAAQALVRLAKLTGDKTYSARAAKIFTAFHALLDLAPVQVESMLLALEWHCQQGAALDSTPGAVLKPVSKIQRGPVLAELFVREDKLRKGQVVPLAVILTIEHGYHVQAHKPVLEGMVGTAMHLSNPPKGFELKDERYPASKRQKLGADEVQVYSESLTVFAELHIPKSVESHDVLIAVDVTWQACNDRACQGPETVKLGLQLPVVEPDAPVQLRHNKEFQAYKP